MVDKLKKIANLILDYILPKDPKIMELENMSELEISKNIPRSSEMKNSNHKALFQYKDKIVKKAIWAIKYNKNRNITNKFSNLLYEYIIEELIDEMLFSSFISPILLPIPMHRDDYEARGYNQSELIAREIHKIDEGRNFDFLPSALTKIKLTPHQSNLKNKTDRLKNLKDCFCVDTNLIKNKNIILIDDVITTGTTMSEATRALKNAGAKNVICFSIAH